VTAYRTGFEAGGDHMAYSIGQVILELGAKGTGDGEIIRAVEDMIALRMMAGLDDAVAQLAAKEES
jgi:hypothetical protein